MTEPQETPESKKLFVRTRLMRQLGQPRELKSALLKVLASEYIQKKCKLSLLPGEEFLDDLVDRIEKDLVTRAQIQVEADKLLKKDDRRTLGSAYQDQIQVLGAAIREVLSKEFRVPLEELNERLVLGILGAEQAGGGGKADNAKSTVLIVDDTKQTRKILKTLLEKNGFRVIEAEDGEEGLYALGKNKIDIALVDVSMPRMNGKEFLKYIKSNPTFKNIPIVMVSAQGDTNTVRETIALGALDFIVKPFKSAIVIDKVTKIVAGAK